MVENMFFLDSELVGMGVMLSPRKTVCLFMLYAWFLKIILVVMIFLVQLLLGM